MLFHFEIQLAKYINEIYEEREAKEVKKAEEERLNQGKIAEDFLRNNGETRSQVTNIGKRGNR